MAEDAGDDRALLRQVARTLNGASEALLDGAVLQAAGAQAAARAAASRLPFDSSPHSFAPWLARWDRP